MVRSGRNGIVIGAAVVIGVFVYARMTAEPDGPEKLFTFADERIAESSGLAVSKAHDGVFYTHNDSDDAARIFAVDQGGQTLAVITLRDTEARDWEAIAVGADDDGKPAIFVADIGDNLGGAWRDVSIYRIPEPRVVEDVTVEPTRFRFTYEDGPRDAEAMLIDPRDNRIYVASREDGGGGLYRAPDDPSATERNELQRVADVPALITDGAFAPDGEQFVLRDYLTAHIYDKPGNEVRKVVLPFGAQGESITYVADGTAWLVGSEGEGSAVWRVPVAATAAGGQVSPSPTAERTNPGSPSDRRPSTGPGDDGSLVLWGNALALAVAGVAIIGLIRVIRERRKKPS